DRAFEEAAFLDPGGAGHLAIAVQRVPAGKARPEGLAARQDGGDAGADGALADLDLAFALDDRRITYGDALDIGNRVVRAGRPDKGNAEVAGARLVRCRCRAERYGEADSARGGQYQCMISACKVFLLTKRLPRPHALWGSSLEE